MGLRLRAYSSFLVISCLCGAFVGCRGDDDGGGDHDAGVRTDAGGGRTDAGIGRDAGPGRQDGSVGEDAGGAVDSGTSAEDAGSVGTDAGTVGIDSGIAPDVDAGEETPDAGTPSGDDAGVTPGEDAGLVRVDAGPPLDACATAGMICSEHAACVGDGAAAHCVCNAGYEGTGVACSAIPTVLVLRLGTGTAALSNASTAVALEERRITDGSLVRTIEMPVVMAGGNFPFTLSGTASSEGGLSRSPDGRYVTLAGYAAAPGVASIASSASATVSRVVARIDPAGAIDTTTTLNVAFSGNNVRSATTVTGDAFWVAGANSSAQYVALGSTGASTTIATTPTNLRQLHVFGAQLYVSAATGSFQGVSTVGTGLPTTAGQTITLLPGFPTTSGPSAFSFLVLDRSATVAGPDTIYVAQDVTPGADQLNVQKWTFDGTTWSVATFTPSFTGASVGARGLTGYVTAASTVRLVATTSESVQRLVTFVDDGSTAPVVTLLATPSMNTTFRGVALAPVALP